MNYTTTCVTYKSNATGGLVQVPPEAPQPTGIAAVFEKISEFFRNVAAGFRKIFKGQPRESSTQTPELLDDNWGIDKKPPLSTGQKIKRLFLRVFGSRKSANQKSIVGDF